MPDSYVASFAACSEMFEEAAYSDHPMEERQREQMLCLLEETETALWKAAGKKRNGIQNALDTLQSNNYLFVNKMAYKFKDHPERGDIIVFRSELINEEDGSKKLLIKRVIGVEGDVISFEDVTYI